MQEISLADWPLLIDLERSYYEKRAYEALLSYMAINKISNTDIYFKEYIEVIKQYTMLCRKLENEVITPTMNNAPYTWEVNFDDKYVAVKEDSQ